MRVEVRYRDGHANKHVAAPVVYERVKALAVNGKTDAKDVVDDARPIDSPLHPVFEWDDSIAAESYREDQARRLIRSVVIVQYDDRDREIKRTEPVFLPVARPYQNERGYMESTDAMSDPVVRESIIAVARSQLEGWVKRNRNIQELADIAIEVERALARAPKKIKNRVKRKLLVDQSPNP